MRNSARASQRNNFTTKEINSLPELFGTPEGRAILKK